MRADGTGAEMVSTGKGRTTCSFYLPQDRRILFSSTHEADAACPAAFAPAPLPLPGRSFDRVLCALVVDHVAALGPFCAELGRLHVHRGQIPFPELPRF